MQKEPCAEFSRIVDFDQIGSKGIDYHVEARADELALLARRFGLLALHHLSARFFLEQAGEPACYHIKGRVKGEVVQACVSTLQEVPARVEASFELLLRPCVRENNEVELEIDVEDSIDTEFYSTPSIDLGETAAQYLYLNLDPFPRAPNAPFLGTPEEKAPPGPFAQALKKIRDKQ